MEERRTRILRALDEEPGLTHAELSERVDLPPRRLLLVLQFLEERGQVLREANRWFPAV